MATCDNYELRRAQDEAEHYRRQMEDAALERQRERDEMRRERASRWESEQRSANTWPEALRKQAALLGAEVYLEDNNDPTENHYFSGGRDACKRALVLWDEEVAKVAEKIAELERQIAELRDGVATTVGERLEAENANDGWVSVAGALQELSEDEGEFSEWLNW